MVTWCLILKNKQKEVRSRKNSHDVMSRSHTLRYNSGLIAVVMLVSDLREPEIRGKIWSSKMKYSDFMFSSGYWNQVNWVFVFNFLHSSVWLGALYEEHTAFWCFANGDTVLMLCHLGNFRWTNRHRSVTACTSWCCWKTTRWHDWLTCLTRAQESWISTHIRGKWQQAAQCITS